MPTASQSKILSKIGIGTSSTRSFILQRAAEESDAPVYVPPVPKIFSFGRKAVRSRHDPADGDQVFFPEMTSMATLLAGPGKEAEDMSADEIMKRLQELGWRKEGDSKRYNEEKRKREEDKQRAEEEQFSKRREALDLINDPVLKRLKEKNRSGTKYSKAPDSRPFAVCFDLVGPSVAHSTVKFKLDQLFEQLNDTDVKLVSLEYQPRAMHIPGDNVGNRWVITLDSQFGVSRLDGCKMVFGKQEVVLKSYDETIGTEYKAYTRQSNFKKMFAM